MGTPRLVALITGITGQDGACLARFMLEKGYEVHGLKRRTSSFNTQRIDDIFSDLHLHHGDVTDTSALFRVLSEIKPSEVYNLAAQSHVQVSFEIPEYTAQVDALGPLRVLEAVRILGLDCKVYQASSSEMFGSAPPPQNEDTPFCPRSPYAAAKAYAYWTTCNYREAYGLHASNGILFNHEGPQRGETFVTRKITRAVSAISKGEQEKLLLGNLDARRDWGDARDFVRGMWLMLQQEEPGDYVLATGTSRSVREFAETAFSKADMEIEWRGEGEKETGVYEGRTVVAVDPKYYRPTEVQHLRGDASKAREVLGWEPEIPFETMLSDMLAHDMRDGR